MVGGAAGIAWGARRLVVALALAAIGSCAPTTPTAPSLGQARGALVWRSVGALPVPIGDGAVAVVVRSAAGTTLAEGKVLLVGGASGIDAGVLSAAQLYDPKTGAWSKTAPMKRARINPVAAVLDSGQVLVVGGQSLRFGGFDVGAAEIWDPSSETWADAGSISAHATTASRLPDGRIFVTGQEKDTAVFDPTTGTWTTGPTMAVARFNDTATVLPSGEILVVGGNYNEVATFAEAEIVASTGASVRSVAKMAQARSGHRAVLLPDGTVLVAGGSTGMYPFPTYATVELYDPALDKWTAALAMPTARTGFAIEFHPTLKKVVVAGGFRDSDSPELFAAEAYDPVTKVWKALPALSASHGGPAYATLDDGALLVAGGRLGFVSGPVVSAVSEILAAKCIVDEDCGAGGHCSDGVCCDSPCLGACQACDEPGKSGTCVAVLGESRPGHPSCGAYLCGAGSACATKCTTSADCHGGAPCTGSTCAPPKSIGDACAIAGECASGHCTDGHCCDLACDLPCAACDVAGSIGTCTLVTVPHPAASRPTCGAIPECAPTCTTAASACTGPAPGTSTSCGVATCTAGVEHHVGKCDGLGACLDTPVACAPYACSGTKCRVDCVTDDHCAPGMICDHSGKCVPGPSDAGTDASPGDAAADAPPEDAAVDAPAASRDAPDGSTSLYGCSTSRGRAGDFTLVAHLVFVASLVLARRRREARYPRPREARAWGSRTTASVRSSPAATG